ncbi:MAG: flavodoxin-dependent (E)-4-hydroxy-3-methylbut-2-enyl-diphosphate synthase [Clostridia bacterium]|nr:flavodoxin-dependent (E)-4-hydroxy-3-methylbut-2-enyl-diphosphate synthase [Clostridia bacterium]
MLDRYNAIRRAAREVTVGRVKIGGKHPIAVQSMTNTDTLDVGATLRQVQALEAAGCDVVRITAPSVEAAKTFAAIKEAGVHIPLVADIHFDYRTALECAAAGVDKIRINPGNIGDELRVRAVADACRAKNIPIRIGVNGGSLEKEILAKYGAPTAEALAESALYHASLLEKYDFCDIVLSVKSSDPLAMVGANKILAGACDYPIHIGVTEAGGGNAGLVKGAVGIGGSLLLGIGDTVRVSLTENPPEEVRAARDILSALDIDARPRLSIVACPTCGRTKIDLIPLVKAFEAAAQEANMMDKPLKVALMGCAVNGPGEAREADIGIAGGVHEALLFKKGEIVEKIREDDIIPRLIAEIQQM